MTKEAVRQSVAIAICEACNERPHHVGDAYGNEFRWQDYLDIADAAMLAMGVAARKNYEASCQVRPATNR